ncbi:hypothetical protein JW998_09375 [candidate division KSB1 bacterium]|nr:hypothetical protein [candidate division KSB1 bacterium]
MKNMGILLFVLLTTTTALSSDWSWQIGPNLSFAYPFEKYANANTLGEGLGAKIIYNWGGNEWLSPRVDFIYLSYGEKRSNAAGQGGYGLIVETRNESFQLTTGVHIARPDGIFRYYLSPLAGIFNYRAVTTLPELYYYYGYPAMDTHDSQWKWGARLQGGLLFDIGLGPLIDIGFTYQRIFNVETRLDDDIVLRGDAEDFMLTLGIMIFAK